MQPTPLTWQDLTLTHTFSDHTQPARFWDLQVQAEQALRQFVQSPFGSALILKTDTLPEELNEIGTLLNTLDAAHLIAVDFTPTTLFGYRLFLEKTGQVETVSGLLAQAENQILILNPSALRQDLSQWDKLKHALLFGQYTPYQAPNVPQSATPLSARFKLLLLGNRDDIAALHLYDDTLFQFCQYSEIEAYLNLNRHIDQWGSYVQHLANRYLSAPLSGKALNQLLNYEVRQSESRDLIAFSPTTLKQHLTALAAFQGGKPYQDIQAYFNALEARSAVLHRYALQDILTDQHYIETTGEEIGQINGLSVVEFDGVPHAFGEPIRISCNVQHGEGEIHDIERKVELGGNLHAKGILLAQSCLANLLDLPTQLPFSATVAFEQSYGEIDGDSASLAIFCTLISSLAKRPLPQSLAVTGAIDQFGNVLSVGGVNQKIEGFFDICNARGLDGTQGVIIPSVCHTHLSLKPAVVSAVKQGKFNIWCVEDVFEALEILLGLPFYEEDLALNHNQETLHALIQQQLDQQNPQTSGSFWQKIFKFRQKNRQHD